MTKKENPEVINLDDFRGWVEIGSLEWDREVMAAINECIARIKDLEDQCGIQWKRPE